MSLRDILRFIVIACFFVTPFICLYVPASMFFPFITGKNFTFRILVEIMLGAWALLAFIDARYRPRFSWILISAATFLGVIAVADFMGVNPYRSFWSNYERMEGLITHAHLFLYFIISGSVLATDALWKWFWRLSLGVSLLVASNAYAQLMGTEAVHQSSNRLDATLGNSTYLAVYALFNVFIALFLFVRDAKVASYGKWAYIVIALINTSVLYYTQTRGAFLGLVGGLFLALLLAALFDKERPERRKYALGGVVATIILVGLFIEFRQASWIQENRTLGRIANISLTDSTTQSRFLIWGMSWDGFKERPILGWGQDNFLYVFSKHYNPKMWNQEPWFDRSHDVFFDWLIAGGALGLLAYLSLFGAALYYLWSSRNKHFSVIERALLTGMLAGYFVHNIFVFDNITSYLIFFGFLGYIHTLNATAPTVEEVRTTKKGRSDETLESGDLAIAAVIIMTVTAGMVYFVNMRNINANIALINAIRPETIMTTGANGQKEIALEKVIALDLFGTAEASEQLAQLAIQAADPRVPENLRRQFFDITSKQFEESMRRDPESLRTISFAAAFYERFGQYDKAIELFEKAIVLSPKRQASYLDYAQLLTALGRYSEANNIAKKAYELETGNPDAAVVYATVRIYQKDLAEAERVMAPFKGSAILYNSRLINAYGSGRYFDKVVVLLNEKIAKGYGVPRDYFLLAGGYSGLGDNKKARDAIETAVSLDSSLRGEADQYLKQLETGSIK